MLRCKILGHNFEWKFFDSHGNCKRCGLKGEKVIPQGIFLRAVLKELKSQEEIIKQLQQEIYKKDEECDTLRHFFGLSKTWINNENR